MTSLTRRELAQTLLATTAVAALVPALVPVLPRIPIVDAPWRHEFEYVCIETWEALTASDLHVEFNAILGKI